MAKRRRKKKRIRIGRVILLFIMMLIPVAAAVALVFFIGITKLKPVSSVPEVITYTVESGSSAKGILQDLAEKKIINSSSIAYLYAKKEGLDSIKAGTYELDKSYSTQEILEILNDPTAAMVDTVTVTIIEGDWAKNAAAKIADATNLSADDLLSLWNDESYVRSLMSDYPFLTDEIFNENIRILLEGYLAPNTYEFYRETTADTVTRKLLDAQLSVFNNYYDQILNSSYSIHEIYTLASIVQYESGKVDDMKMIAGVFYNRLENAWPLQSSVTVCYALDSDKGENWMACEANADYESPYNTYKYPGLPPGPIVSAGHEAIEAVLNPTESDYFYFMADVNTGTVYYAKTLAEHNANCAKYMP